MRFPRHKFNAIRVERDGFKFDSKKEGRRYDELVLLQKANEIVMFLFQVPFRLPGPVVYWADFMIFWADGTVTVEDVKGYDTPMSKLKRKQVEALFPVKIDII